jgi:very-short-patch-repair endonuclease
MANRTDAAILAVAARAAGVCTRVELRRAGVPDRTIGHRVRSGSLVRVGSGIYEVRGLTDPDTRLHRAVKAHPCGAISHLSAARLWGFPVAPAEPNEPVRVTVPRRGGTRPRVPGVEVHGSRHLPPDEVGEPRPGLASTSPARTIVDLAGSAIGDRRLRHVVQTQVVAGQLGLVEVTACLDRFGSRGVAGAGRLRRLIDRLDDGEPVPGSELERRLAGLLGPGFRRQYRPPWYDGVRGVVDFAQPASWVIVEADGRRWHAVGQSMVDDRRRDRLAATNGWLVLRVTWDDVVERPSTTAAEVAAVVTARASSAA